MLLGSNEAYANGVLAVTGTFGYATEYPAEEDKGEVLYVVTPEPTLDLDRDGSNFFVVKDGKMYRHRQEWCVRRGLELCNYLDCRATRAPPGQAGRSRKTLRPRSKGWAHWTYQGRWRGATPSSAPRSRPTGGRGSSDRRSAPWRTSSCRPGRKRDRDGRWRPEPVRPRRAVRRANGRIAPTANNAASSRSHCSSPLASGSRAGRRGRGRSPTLPGRGPVPGRGGFERAADQFRWDPTNSKAAGRRAVADRVAGFLRQRDEPHAMAFCPARPAGRDGQRELDDGPAARDVRRQVQDGEGVKRHSLTKRLAETENELYMLRLYEGPPGNGHPSSSLLEDNKGAMHVGPFRGRVASTASYLVVQGRARMGRRCSRNC